VGEAARALMADEVERQPKQFEVHHYRPAVGTPGEPAFGERASEQGGEGARDGGAGVGFHRPAFEDGRWSYLFGADTQYATREPEPGELEDAARRARGGLVPDEIQGPVLQRPVWTWEIPVYFWLGGVTAGSSFVALACDLAGDGRSAAIARRVSLATVIPCPVLLIGDLGRPLRFLNMLRIFKPRSPMSTGAWCLVVFSQFAAASVGADLLGRRRLAGLLGGAQAFTGGYLGSYTGVLLAATAVPVWARSRLFLGPIFVATGAATGAAATRLVLAATGLPAGHPTERSLGRVETLAMTAELTLSEANERRLGPLAHGLHEGRAGKLFRAAKTCTAAGLGLRALGAGLARRSSARSHPFARRSPARMRLGRPENPMPETAPWLHHTASALYLTAGLLFRLAWVEAGKTSAADDRAVARMHRSAVFGD
jgi:hypothetical protein